MKDASLRSRLTLQFVDRWPLESCLEILAYCISDTAVQDGLKCELQRKLAELQVYQKVWAQASRERKERGLLPTLVYSDMMVDFKKQKISAWLLLCIWLLFLDEQQESLLCGSCFIYSYHYKYMHQTRIKKLTLNNALYSRKPFPIYI